MFLELRNVTKRYKVRRGLFRAAGVVNAVNGVNLSVRQGETLGLVGESGCGKSTLARLILGLEQPNDGTVVYQGRYLADLDQGDLRQKVQMIFQDPYSSLNPRHRVGAIVREAMDIHKMYGLKERERRVAELLIKVGLRPEHARRYPHEFSGGQRQRVAIARTLGVRPELIVCDEPVSALDVSIRAQVLNLLDDLQDDFGLTYVFISHDLSVVGHVSDRVAVMYLGRIVELAPADDFFDEPLHPYAQALLSAVPVPDPDHAQARIALSGDVPSALNPPEGCPFHPRCPQALDICKIEPPAFVEAAKHRFTACWLHPDKYKD